MSRRVVVKGESKRGKRMTIECSVPDSYPKDELCVAVYKQIKPDLREVHKVSVAKSKRHAAMKLHGDTFKSIVRARREAQAWESAQMIDLSKLEPNSDEDDRDWLKEKAEVSVDLAQAATRKNETRRRPLVVHHDASESETEDRYPSWVELLPEPLVEKARSKSRQVRFAATRKPAPVFSDEKEVMQDPVDWCQEMPGSFPQEKPMRKPAYPGHRPYQGNA